MNRLDFIDELHRALASQLSVDEIRGHIEYYNEYIDMQIRKGSTEEEIISSLGNPRLLAKSILEANVGNKYNDSSDVNDAGSSNNGSHTFVFGKSAKWSLWIGIVLLVIIFLTVIGVLFSVLAILIRFFFPIIVCLFVIKLIATLFKRK